MNKNNKRVFHISEGDMIFDLPIIGEEVRQGDTVMVESINDLGMTIKQMVEYLILLQKEGILFKSNKERHFNFGTPESNTLMGGLEDIQEASKTTLSNNSKNRKGSGAKKGSYNKLKEVEILGMYGHIKNISMISANLEVSRNTVYKTLKRNKLI